MSHNLNTILHGKLVWLCVLCLFFSEILRPNSALAQELPPVPQHQEFIQFFENLKEDFIRQGVADQTFDTLLKRIQYKEGVIESDRNQPESKFTLAKYLSLIVSQQRIKKGKEMMQIHRDLLQEVSAIYGVPAHVLVAFWGIESFYGSYTGKVELPSALATLTYDKRRRTFFKKQLVYMLRLISEGHIAYDDAKGSWAGAMGQMQFIPSTYFEYAVDGDGDKKIDLWHSKADIFSSASSYLQQMGWRTGEKWGRAIKLPSDFAFNPKDKKTVSEWKALGLRNWNGKPLPDSDIMARIVQYENHNLAFLVYPNFDVILRWNRSHLYAIAVGLLSDHFANRKDIPKHFNG